MSRTAHVQIGDQKYDLNTIASLFIGSSKNEKPKVTIVEEEEKVREDEGEFWLISRDFFTVDLNAFTKKYPFISAVATVALGFFGLMNVLSLSLVNIFTGAFLGVLSVGLGKSLWKMENLVARVWTNAFNATRVPDEKEEEETETIPLDKTKA